MNDKPQSSFIPRNPVRGSSQPRPVKRVYLLSIIGTVLFIGSLTIAGGVWFYNYSLEVDLQTEQARLASEQEVFNQSSLERVLEFESRLNSAKQLFTQQMLINDILTALEQNTLAANSYQALEYSNPRNQAASLSLIGVAPDFNATIFQREVFKNHPQLASASFTEVTSGATQEESEAGLITSSSDVTFTIEYKPQMKRSNSRALPANNTELPPVVDTPEAEPEEQADTEDPTGATTTASTVDDTANSNEE